MTLGNSAWMRIAGGNKTSCFRENWFQVLRVLVAFRVFVLGYCEYSHYSKGLLCGCLMGSQYFWVLCIGYSPKFKYLGVIYLGYCKYSQYLACWYCQYCGYLHYQNCSQYALYTRGVWSIIRASVYRVNDLCLWFLQKIFKDGPTSGNWGAYFRWGQLKCIHYCEYFGIICCECC